MGVTIEQLTQLNDLSKNLKLQLGSMMLTFEDVNYPPPKDNGFLCHKNFMNKYSLNRHSRYLEEMLPILETIQQHKAILKLTQFRIPSATISLPI